MTGNSWYLLCLLFPVTYSLSVLTPGTRHLAPDTCFYSYPLGCQAGV
jgi:hypothetical protein